MSPAATLGDICDITMGQAPDGESYNDRAEGVPLIAGAGDFGNGVPAAKKYTTAASKLSAPGDIVLSIRASIGDRVRSDGIYCLGRGVAGLRPRRELAGSYLWHCLDWVSPQLVSKGRGATFLQVNRADIAELELPLPSIEEQRRIADILDRADALRATRRDALAILGDLTQSIFLDMFRHPDPSWANVTVTDLVDRERGGIRTGPFGSQLLHSEFVDEGIAVLGIDNAVGNRFAWGRQRFITPAKYHALRRYKVSPGDVLITIMGTCGRAAIVPDDVPVAINTKHLCCISLDTSRCLPEYLHAYFLQHPAGRGYLSRSAKGAIMSGLNMAIIRGMPIPVPPIDRQSAFVERLRSIRQTEEAHLTQLAALQELIASLQQRAFAGEL